MRIAVIAASGRSGQAFVREALAAGHTVHAGIRGENPFEPSDTLKVLQCDATDLEQVTALIDRCDAVVSLIGHVKGSSDFVQSDATKTLVRAMEVAGIKRLVSLTGVGVWVPGDRFRLFVNLLNRLSALVGVKRFEDGIRHVKILKASKLDFTVLRVLLLTSGEPGKFTLRAHGFAKVPTPRREVAQAILQVLRHEWFIREYPVVGRH
jgi:uncharacterized protein YbjT (DUF2867 family)